MSPEPHPSVLPAVYTVLGAVIATAVPAFVEWWKEGRVEAREAAREVRQEARDQKAQAQGHKEGLLKQAAALHQGARLLSLEFEVACSVAKWAAAIPNQRISETAFAESAVWADYRAVFAAELPPRAWTVVKAGFTVLDRMARPPANVANSSTYVLASGEASTAASVLEQASAALQPYTELPHCIMTVAENSRVARSAEL